MKTYAKTVSLILTFLFIFSLVSCSDGSVSSEAESIIESVPDTVSVPSEVSQVQRTSTEAYAMLGELLSRDRKIVGLFIGCSLFDDGFVNAGNPDLLSSYMLKSSCEYNDFSLIEDEIDSLYSAGALALTEFYKYPAYGEKSISVKDGSVYASLNGKREFDYPSFGSFVLKTLNFDGADFTFTSGGKKYTLSVDFASETLSDSVYMIVASGSKYDGKWESNPLLTGIQNSASASKLTGKVLVVNVFMDDSKSAWTQSERKQALEMQKQGIQMLEKEALRYGADVDFTVTGITDSLLYKHKTSVGTAPEDHIWINLMFSYTTFGTLDKYIASFFDLTEYDSYCVFFHINKAGESYSVACNSDRFDASLYECERSVVFYDPSQKDEYKACAAIYAHELLHMFGAPELDTDAARNYFANDPMANITVTSQNVAIGDYTAFTIGWLNSCDPFLTQAGLLTLEDADITE